jgi:glycosyltransferase involved in cell wall biosynthesis
MNRAGRIELAFVSRARAERFGPGYTLIPLPVEPVAAPMALASKPREAGVWSISEPHPWSIGIVGQVSGSVVEPTDSKLIAEIATQANVLTIYDPGRYRFLLGATASIRFVSRSNGGLAAFIASVDCLYCRPQQWWDEGTGREVLIAMALGKPVVCPRSSMHAWLIEDRVDGLLYETQAESLGMLHDLHRAPLWAAKLGEAARSKARSLIDAAMLEESYRSITPAARISADKARHDH